MSDESLIAVVSRLNVIISLLLDGGQAEKPASVTSKIARLEGMGLAPSEIGAIVGKKSNYVSAVLSERKRKGQGNND